MDLTPAPGGIGGAQPDFVRWSPPDQPYLWGAGFPTPWGLNYFSQWTNQFLPTTRIVTPDNVSVATHLYPASFGQNGDFQLQLNGIGVPRSTVPQHTVDRLYDATDTQAAAGGPSAFAGAWGRVS